jgi:AmmeMemoRadiSam system protein A
MRLTAQSRELLIGIARRAIERGLQAPDSAAPAVTAEYPAEVRAERACFVTLTTAPGGLRGCRGGLEARRALLADVWHHAQASAFDDPRFPPVTPAEISELRIEVSVLGPLQPLAVASEAELLRLLVPGRDGLVLALGDQRVTFLPKVWDMLPAPRDFLEHLRHKAGLPRDFWSPALQLWRYEAESFGTAPL